MSTNILANTGKLAIENHKKPIKTKYGIYTNSQVKIFTDLK